MNIREYYSYMTKIYLYQLIIISLFTSFCLCILIRLGIIIQLKYIFTLICIILVYYFIKYHYYLCKGSSASLSLDAHKKVIHNSNFFLLKCIPAPVIHLKVFKTNGLCEWDISEIRQQSLNLNKKPIQVFELKKRDGNRFAIFNFSRFHNTSMEIIFSDLKLILNFKKTEKNKEIFILNSDEYAIIKKTSAVEIIKDGKILTKVSIGLMPINWQKKFSPNTPVIELNEKIEEKDFYICFCLLIYCHLKYKGI